MHSTLQTQRCQPQFQFTDIAARYCCSMRLHVKYNGPGRARKSMTNKDECQPFLGDLLRDLPVHSFCFSRHQSQSRYTVRPMHISVGCMGLDMGVINNLVLCKVNAPLTTVELTNNRHAEYTHRGSRLCTFVSCMVSARSVRVGAGSSTCRI